MGVIRENTISAKGFTGFCYCKRVAFWNLVTAVIRGGFDNFGGLAALAKMGGAVDPTYPLFPVASLIAAAMLLLVLLNSFIRQSWNLGVIFLCFWLFLEDLASAIGTIIWSDNADVKLYVYCDIVTHLQLATAIVKPMATLMITRRLYIIASLESVDLATEAARRREMIIEWTLGLGIPVLVAGPIYYVNQIARFEVLEGFGCTNASNGSILSLLIEQSWYIVPPLISVTLYYPRVVRMFYKQRRDVDRFLDSNNSVSRLNYLRILALASIDIVLTLPFGIVNIVLIVTSALDQDGSIAFYPGWTALHSNWAPGFISYAELQAFGTSTLALEYFVFWTAPVLSFTIFGLFGVTKEARASYWHFICIIGGWFGWKPTPRAGNAEPRLGTMEFGARPQETISFDAEMGTNPSYIGTSLGLSSFEEKDWRHPAGLSASAASEGALGHPEELESDSTSEQLDLPRNVEGEAKGSVTLEGGRP